MSCSKYSDQYISFVNKIIHYVRSRVYFLIIFIQINY